MYKRQPIYQTATFAHYGVGRSTGYDLSLIHILLMIVEVIGEVLLPKFMANIINIGAANQDVPYIITMGIVMVVTCLLYTSRCV